LSFFLYTTCLFSHPPPKKKNIKRDLWCAKTELRNLAPWLFTKLLKLKLSIGLYTTFVYYCLLLYIKILCVVYYYGRILAYHNIHIHVYSQKWSYIFVYCCKCVYVVLPYYYILHLLVAFVYFKAKYDPVYIYFVYTPMLNRSYLRSTWVCRTGSAWRRKLRSPGSRTTFRRSRLRSAVYRQNSVDGDDDGPASALSTSWYWKSKAKHPYWIKLNQSKYVRISC
jgi:hypothetical protein